jgi:transposase InsO family protein
MSGAAVRVGVGSRFHYDGEIVEVVELLSTAAGGEVVLKDGRGQVLRLSLRELLAGGRARVVAPGPGPVANDPQETAAVVLAHLSKGQREAAAERAAHVREVLTGFRSGSAELAGADEPRAQFTPELALGLRYAAKAADLGVTVRTVERWVGEFHRGGEAALAVSTLSRRGSRVDERWRETALEVMAEHTGRSRPSRLLVIERTRARLDARLGVGTVRLPSRATAFRVLEELEERHPTFRLSTKRNVDIAGRPAGVYGKLRPTRPGEYLLMDTTRLDVFALDPVTLRWLQAELTVAMDWYTRCITGIRVTPVSTKAIDVSLTLYQAYRPPPAPEHWPAWALWPEHGVPRGVLVDRDAFTGPRARAAGPVLVPETLVVDHGQVYVSDHLTSVTQRLGISVQPARLRTGRDKGPIERFFRTLREDLLQALPGYKGPDLYSRGLDPEREAFFFLHELEAVVREWIATVYHCRPHAGLVDPHLPGLALSPAQMFEHGIARAGYIEAPRDPDLAFEFLKCERRVIQHYGVNIDSRCYNGPGLDPYRNARSPYPGGKWPIHVNPDDIAHVYFRDPQDYRWHMLTWEHAPACSMPLSDEALAFARQLAATAYQFPDDRTAVTDLFNRWDLGLDKTPAERRLALRLSRDQAVRLDLSTADPGTPGPLGPQPGHAHLPAGTPLLEEQEGGEEDTDDFDDTDDGFDDDFYADALEDV